MIAEEIKPLEDRIEVKKFINKISTFTFDMLRHTDFQKVFPTSYRVDKTLVDDNNLIIEIDDYIFSFHRYSPDEANMSSFNLNDNVCVGKHVTVWLGDKDGNAFECDGTLSHLDGEFSLTMEVEVK